MTDAEQTQQPCWMCMRDGQLGLPQNMKCQNCFPERKPQDERDSLRFHLTEAVDAALSEDRMSVRWGREMANKYGLELPDDWIDEHAHDKQVTRT